MGCGCGSYGLFVGTRASLPRRTFVLDEDTLTPGIDVAHAGDRPNPLTTTHGKERR